VLVHTDIRVNFPELGGGYNYDSTSIRLRFDGATTVRRPNSRLYAYLCARAAALRPE